MSPVDTDLLAHLDQLQLDYIHALDSKDMAAWLATFVEDDDASYVCLAAENAEHDLPVAYMLDDSRARLEDRCTYIDRIWQGTFQDYRTRHFVQRVRHEPAGDGEYRVLTNFSVLFTPETGVTEVLCAGRYEDVVSVNGRARFRSKRAVLDTAVTPRYLVYPL